MQAMCFQKASCDDELWRLAVATEIQYFWGADLSETLQGAGGVGGLLAVSCNNNFYFPAYDNNGNVTKYIDEGGNVVAVCEIML